MKNFFAISVFILACILFVPSLNAAPSHFIINPIEPSPEAVVNQEDYENWQNANQDFKGAETGLLEAYKNCLKEFGPGGEGWLQMNQSDWAKIREETAYNRHAPKGSPDYLAYFEKEAKERIEWLDKLAKKGQVIYAQSYLFKEPGFSGMLILYGRGSDIEIDFYTENTATRSVCQAWGQTQPSGGKATFEFNNNTFNLEMIDLGKSIILSSDSQNGICQDSGKFTGSYELTK